MEAVNSGQFKKGGVPWNKGLKGYKSEKRNQEWKDNISEGLKRCYDERGRKGNANKLARTSREYSEWRRQVFERDGFACQECGSNKEIHPHHIKLFSEHPELRYDVENGITLCSICHGVVHGMNFQGLGRHLTCEVCAASFRPKCGHLSQKTCSRECGNKLKAGRPSPFVGKARPEQYKKPDRVCKCCGISFRAKGEITGRFGSKKRRVQKYCSQGCYLKDRWNFTGKQAVHAETGKTFDEMSNATES